MNTNTVSRTTDLNPFAISKAEAARLLGISVRSVESYIALKKIESRKLGRRRVVLVSSLQKFLRQD